MIGDILGQRGGTMVASFQMAGDIGAVTGPVVAGFLVDTASYTAAFTVAAAVLVLAAVLGVLAPETRPGPAPGLAIRPGASRRAVTEPAPGPGADPAGSR
jgi:MFS family permease